jgi:hypothetical protein
MGKPPLEMTDAEIIAFEQARDRELGNDKPDGWGVMINVLAYRYKACVRKLAGVFPDLRPHLPNSIYGDLADAAMAVALELQAPLAADGTVQIRIPREVAQRLADPKCKQNRHLVKACRDVLGMPHHPYCDDPPETVEIKFDMAEDDGEWAAMRRAEAYIREQGWSVGPSCMSGNRGILKRPDVRIAKWRNLSPQEKRECDGILIGRGRDNGRIIAMAS